MAKRNDLTETLPQLQGAEAQLHDYARSVLGIDYRIADFGAFRTLDDTNEIMGYRAAEYAAAVRANPNVANTPINVWRPISAFGSSWHNYGAAFDVLITDRGRYASGGAALQALKEAAPTFGLRSDVPNDPPHFELPVSLDEAAQLWADYTNGDGAVNVLVRGSADSAALVTVAVVGIILFALKVLRR